MLPLLFMPGLMMNNRGKRLLQLARASIAQALGMDYPSQDAAATDEQWLQDKAACFVTLKKQGELRGCIGTLEAYRCLRDDVEANAKAAAFKDPRFPPLTAAEFNDIEIEISLLSPMQTIKFSNEQEALALIQPGVDGIVFEYGVYRSTFLPQVWQQLPGSSEFMAHLKQKAGLPAGFWDDDVKLYRYHVSKWQESDFAAETEGETE